MARRTKAEAQATRDSIIDAAERVFHARGVSQTTLQDIADAAGVTRGAIYWHFADKASVFGAMVERAFLPVENASALTHPLPGEAPLQTLRRHVCGLLQRVVADEALRRVADILLHKVELAGEMTLARERMLQARARHVERIESLLAAAGLPPAQCRPLAVGLHALVDGLLENWVLDPGAFDLAAAGEHALDAYLGGVAARIGGHAACGAAAVRRRAPAREG